MTYQTRIIDAQKQPTYDDKVSQLAVTFEVFEVVDGQETVLTKVTHGFPLETTQEEVQAQIEKFAASMAQDKATAEASADFEKANAVADETIAALTGN